MEEVDVKVSGVSRYLVLQPLVLTDVHYTPADHTDLERARLMGRVVAFLPHPGKPKYC